MGLMSVRKRIKDEVEETQQDLEQVKYRGEFFETTTGHIMPKRGYVVWSKIDDPTTWEMQEHIVLTEKNVVDAVKNLKEKDT
jgi:wobble nucleotide-excising tRNase